MNLLNLRTSQAIIFTFAFALCLLATGCVENNGVANTTSTSPANTAVNTAPASNSNNAVTAPAPNLAGVPVTLPLVDALLSDEAAVAELKSRTQLSDEQIQKLRDAGRNSVLQLGEEDDSDRSASAASKEALAKIREIVGAEKADAVANFLRERWAGAGETTLANAPNSIPTDTRIVVNAPAYRMDIFRDGALTKSYKIGIGYPEFPLPAGLRKATEIIFNPTWTPPDEPWVKGKFAPGRKVDAGSPDNPLGVIKIPIGLPSLIHGGKQAARLGNFASHGCVGLTNGQVQDFAVELSALSNKPMTLNDVKEYQKNKTETSNVKLDNPVPVELRYETIVVTTDGKLTIYRDVYERGTNNEENLRRVLDGAGVAFDSLPAPDQEKIRQGLSQMAIDATGNPVDPMAAANVNSAANKSTNSSVTKNLKGKRQVVFDLAALKGKGYPVAVNLKSA